MAEVLGFEHDEALTLGLAVAGLNAYSKGVSLRLFQPIPREVKELAERAAPFKEILAGNSSWQKRVRGLREAGAGPHPQDGFGLTLRSICLIVLTHT